LEFEVVVEIYKIWTGKFGAGKDFCGAKSFESRNELDHLEIDEVKTL
jgi:hypothetical protein